MVAVRVGMTSDNVCVDGLGGSQKWASSYEGVIGSDESGAGMSRPNIYLYTITGSSFLKSQTEEGGGR